jgi:hypothetical protein
MLDRRLAVELALGALAAGDRSEAILEGLPRLEPEGMQACLNRARRLAGRERMDSGLGGSSARGALWGCTMSVPLSTQLDRDDAIPYFLWDQPMTVAELRRRLATASQPEVARLLGKILREARDTDVWKFTTPQNVVALWDELSRHLGRRRGFWQYLLERWRADGLIRGA